MNLSPRMEKFALMAHVTTSVGWLGSVVAFLALAIVGLTSPDLERVRSAYLAMDMTAWIVILPLAFASLFTGLVQSLGTRWGLFRHYWVLMKLGITAVSTIVLVIHMRPIRFLAGVAAEAPLMHGDHVPIRVQMVVASGLAIVALLVATGLSIYKPRGMTPYGWRKQQEERRA